MCTVTLTLEIWSWPVGSRSWHTLGSWTTIVWNIIQIQLGSEDLCPGHRFPVYVHCDLDLGDMTLDQGHDTPLGHGQQVCEILSRSNLAVRSYGPERDFQYMCTVTLTLEIWPGIKVMTHPLVMDFNCVKYYPDRTREYEVMAQTRCEQTDRQTDRQGDSYIPNTAFQYMCTVTLTLEIWPWIKVMTHPWVMGNKCVKLWPGHVSSICALWPRPWRYICTVTLTLEIWPWIKVMTHPLVIDFNCVNYYPDQTREYEVMARTRCEQTDGQIDGQTDRVIPIYPQTLFAGGIKREQRKLPNYY